MSRWLWSAVAALGLTGLVVASSWALSPLKPAPLPPPATLSRAELCKGLERQTFVMADGLRREFRRHHKAHRDYVAGKIPFGPKDKPGTVLWIWRDTLHKGAMHSQHYQELRVVMRAEGCLADGL